MDCRWLQGVVVQGLEHAAVDAGAVGAGAQSTGVFLVRGRAPDDQLEQECASRTKWS